MEGPTHRSTNRKIAALEAKLAALRQAKAAPTTSEQDQDQGGQEWLDGLVPDGEGMLGVGSEEGEGAEGEGKGKGKRIVLDAHKAGLPARPLFDAPAPERRDP